MNNKIKFKVKNILQSNHISSINDAHELIKRFGDSGNIMLDFSGVESANDEFIRELFVVWKEQHSQATLEVVGVSEQIEQEIIRVLKK